MNMGWSDGGHGGLRASNNDRKALLKLLDMAHGEGRLTAVDYARRTDAVRAAKTRSDLVALAVDLPSRHGIRDWIDQMAVRGDDRARASTWLSEAASQGRLAPVEYERRAAALPTVDTYAQLKHLLLGLPGWPGAAEKDLLATTPDREAALGRLTEAVAEGRVDPAEYPALAAEIDQARRVTDLDSLLAAVSGRASDHDRTNAAAQVEAAYLDGRLDVDERNSRINRAHSAATHVDVGHLVEDLRGDGRRLAQSDRQELAARLKRALDEGRLDLAEYESRLRAVYAAATGAETVGLFEDLTDPPRPSRRGPLDQFFDYWVYNSALLPAPRRWWQHLSPKTTWKLLTIGTVLPWIYLGVRSSVWAGLMFGAGWVPVALLLVTYARLARVGAGDIDGKQRLLVADLQSTLEQRHPDLRTVSIELWNSYATVNVTTTGDVAIAAVLEDAVGLLWCSRLYPLKNISVVGVRGPSGGERSVTFTRAERKRLRHLYGPRPYGRLPGDR